MSEVTKPKFAPGKTYDARRGRKKFEILEVFQDDEGEHTYKVRGGFKDGSLALNRLLNEIHVSEADLLAVARVKAKGSKVYLSASQVDTFRRCNRKWAFTYINSEVAPSSKAMEFGSEVHKVLEVYLLTGKWEGKPDAVACARQGEYLLPEPRDKTLGIEQVFFMPILNDTALFMGFIDIVIPERSENTLEISDHKTTKDMRYAVTQDELKQNVQANLYSKWAIDKFRRDAVLARWRYYCSRLSKAKAAVDGRPRNMGGFRAVTRVKDRAEVEEQWALLLEDAERMVAMSNNPAIWAANVEPNQSACGDFGGCPFRDQCPLPQSTLGDLMSRNKNAHTKKPTEAGGKEMGSLMDIINKNKSKAAAPEAASATQEAAAEPATGASDWERGGADGAEGAVGINPPAVPPTEVDSDLLAAAKKPTPQSWIDRLKSGHKPRADKEKSWRADQEKILDKTTKTVVEAPAEKGRPERENGTEPSIGHTAGKELFILLVDCLPAKGTSHVSTSGATTLSEVLRPMKNAVQEMKAVPYWNLLKFREGETLLAACVEQQFRTAGKPVGVVLADSLSVEWKACGDVLVELADVVVRGRA